MGIVKQDCFGIKCDGCGREFENIYTGFGIYTKESYLTDDADEYGWKEINGKWYCADCVEKLFDYDEEKEEYLPKVKED